jgi:hypothetical protein
MLPAFLSPKQLLERTSSPSAEYVSYAHEHFPGLLHAVRVTHANARSLWSELRSQFPNSGYWPLIVSYITNGPPGPWKEMVVSEGKELFSRFYFKEELDQKFPAVRSSEPKSIIDASLALDAHASIAAYRKRFGNDAPEDLAWLCESLERVYGHAPSPDDLLKRVPKAETNSPVAAEKAAFDWLRSRGLALVKTDDPFWYEPIDPLAILLLPIAKPSHALAYIHWWGCHTIGTPSVISLLAKWEDSHGAELMCHYGTVLHLNVSKPIQSAEDAMSIAVDMETIGMQHNSIESAAQLLGAKHWHMHNRP